MTALYIFLGTGVAERLAVIRFLIERGLDPSAGPITLFGTERDMETDPEARKALEGADRVTVVPVAAESLQALATFPPPPAEGTVFFLCNSRANPVDQLEHLQEWMDQHDLSLARIFTVVDCGLLQEHSGAAPWYDACVHFSDVVLLGNREDVPKKWVSDFEKGLQRQALPCHLGLVKKAGSVDSPTELLFPEPRRISQFFDPAPEEAVYPGLEIAIEGDPEDEEGELEGIETESDPYVARTEQGYRVKRLVDINRFLSTE